MKYSKALTKVICKSLEQGCTITATIQAAGIVKDTFYRWMDEKSDFSDSIEKAQSSAIKVVETALLKMAAGTFKYVETHEEQILVGKDKTPAVLKKTIKKTLAPSVAAIVFYLGNRHPKEWKNLKEIKFPGGIPVDIKAEDIFRAWEEAKKQKKDKENKTNAINTGIKSKGKG